MTRVACDASFAKLVSLVAYRDSRRSENQRILRDQFHWLARFVFYVLFQHHWGFIGSVWELPLPSNTNATRLKTHE